MAKTHAHKSHMRSTPSLRSLPNFAFQRQTPNRGCDDTPVRQTRGSAAAAWSGIESVLVTPTHDPVKRKPTTLQTLTPLPTAQQFSKRRLFEAEVGIGSTCITHLLHIDRLLRTSMVLLN